ncbi:mandelate racemase/muconate lactonizing enzyme family protein [Mucilaginibacter boryungensis]|uniref:Mandelate racemase/muconate lactonizing enzyme family protein n=1 Tax=Mucilaginibacter boryungensis TaxID=768480 RepID=A0ABR9XG00_9SPHI|nr:mandelate racemase/muconate lactonizing enzyme family protein [Mucilaginibacter boryungensis]MBE9666120.1 mandelate racemase/muconate lactonizing enzyme family protein [Mucilaginibacter boryungensis]
MKIVDVKTILLTGPCTNDPYLSEARKVRSAAFIEIKTDSGLTGLGETYAGYFFPEGVPEIVEFFKPILLGNNVDDIPGLWAKMYHCGNFWCRVGLGAIVLCGIEAALWDLKGKQENLPVWKLLQKKWKPEFTTPTIIHDKLPCYATGGPSNYPLDKLAGKIDFYNSLGFNGMKIGAGAYYKDQGFNIPSDANEAADLESEKMAYLRQQFGNNLWLMMDAHMGNSAVTTWGLETATAVAKAMEPFNLYFLEEPLHYTCPDLYSELCKNTTTPIAGGECLTAVCEWQTFIEQKSFHIGQPDASFTAGLDQFMQVAASLDKTGRKIAPHAWGAGASQMQNVHCGFACPNTTILEVAPAYGPLHSEVIGDSLQIKNGYALPPEKPGLGIELTEATIKRFPFERGTGEFNSVPGKILTK